MRHVLLLIVLDLVLYEYDECFLRRMSREIHFGSEVHMIILSRPYIFLGICAPM
jgi:hypothetical protein